MTTKIPAKVPAHDFLLHHLKFVVDATELVDSYCVDYLTHDQTEIDRDYLRAERVDHVQRTLAELRPIIERAKYVVAGDPQATEVLLATGMRAAALADAIIEALGVRA